MNNKMVSEKKRASIDRYDQEHYKMFSVKIDKHMVDCFTALAGDLGRSRNDCVKEAIQMFIDKYTDELLKQE